MKFLSKCILSGFLLTTISLALYAAPKKSIYNKGWIDFNKNGIMDVYEDPSAPIEERVNSLLDQMTMDEKTCQLVTLYGPGRVLKDPLPTPRWKTEIWKDGIGNIDEAHNGLGNFKAQYAYPYSKHVQTIEQIQRWFVEETRLGIPVDFTNEGIRGLCHEKATYFPAQCGQGATWNRELIYKIGEVEAKEARALGYTNIYSPILDIAQDPRWGRVVECYGEDPYLVGQLGKQMVLSLQNNRLVSTPKHFAVYSVPVGGRDGGTRTDPHVAFREMRTLYLEPFRVAFQQAGALGVMSSYNDYDGVPITGSPLFLTEILRREWGFKGYVVSDSDALEFISDKHKVANDYQEAIAQAINAGLNVRTNFSKPSGFVIPLRKAIENGQISQDIINVRVKEVLRVKFWLGLFDQPYTGNKNDVDKIVHSREHQDLALEAARQSIVLLKNNNQLLPLSKDLKSVAVIGPNADERKELICRYGPSNSEIKTVYDGIKEMLPNATVVYKKGCEIKDPNFPNSEILKFEPTAQEQKMIAEAIEAAKASEVVIMVLGGNEQTVREERSRTSLNLAGRQEQLLEQICKLGKPVVLVMIDGRAASINYAQKYVPAILHAWFPGEFGGTAVAQTIFGEYNPGGRLAVTFPKTVGQIPYAFPFKPGSEASFSTGLSDALYPFGFGLSYTTFEYSDIKITPKSHGVNGTFEVSCTVKNSGDRLGDEVVQLYLDDLVSSVTTYVKVLRGFERITLKPDELKTVTFTLSPQDLAIWDKDMKFRVEPGVFRVMIGASSKDTRLEGKFEVK